MISVEHPGSRSGPRSGRAERPSQLAFATSMPEGPQEEPGGDDSRGPVPSAGVRSIEVRRSSRRRRTVAAKLEEDRMIVYLPERMSRAEEAEWIERMRERLEARERRQRLNSEGDLERRARHLNDKFFNGELRWTSIRYVTNQQGRYGSCTYGDGTIRISDCIASMPSWVRDYVIIHELAHLAVPDHSKRFWKLVERYPLTERARGFLIAKGMES